MDIEKLTKDVILKNMTPEQQKAVLDSVMASVQESKKARTQKVAENVDLVMQALKKIEAKMLDRVSQAADKVETVASNVKDGKDGRDGEDGKDGKQGIQGPKGADGRNGADGKDGKDGRDGIDGVSVVDAYLDFDNSLVIELSNGKQINVGAVLSDQTAEKVQIVANGGAAQPLLDAIAALQAEIDALIPSQTGNSGKFLTTNGSTLSWASVAGGLSYQGTWNASTNSPTLASSTGTNGYYYIVSVSGSTNLNGITDWVAGDWALYNGTAWQKIDQTWAQSGANSDITSLSGITGGISTADFLQLDTAITPSVGVAKLQWDTTWGGPQIGMEGGNVNLQIGQETLIKVYNNTGSSLTDGQVVYVTGSQGQRLTVGLAKADADSTSATIIGMVTEPISNNASGFVTTQGMVNGLNTSGAADGDIVYLSPTTAGAWTTTKPVAPQHMVMVGYIVKGGSAGAGSIYVNTQNGYELEELHNVLITSAASGNTLIYDAGTGVWKNANISAGTGVSISNGAGSITVTNTAPDQTVSLTGSGTTTVTGTYPNFTVSSSDAYTGTVTSVSGTAGRVTSTGGNTPVLDLATTAVTAGSYTTANITVDAYGRITAASSGSSSSFPSGTKLLFAQTAAPTGWTKDTTNYNNHSLRVVTGTASSGGTVDFTTAFASQAVNGTIANTTATGTIATSTTVSLSSGGSVNSYTLTTADIPSHTHTLNYASGGGSGSPNANFGGFSGTVTTNSTGGGGSHSHGFTNPTYTASSSSTFTGTAHNHTFTGTSINLAVKYLDVILATKD